MYYRPIVAPRKPARRTAQTQKFSAPRGGWIANEALDSPESTQGAFLLENWFPTATGCTIRRGSELYATLGGGDQPVTAIFDYNNGNNKRLFASTATTVYDITSVASPMNYQLSTGTDDIVTDTGDNIGQLSTGGLEVIEGMGGGNWVTTQFATTGGVFLVAVNGQDPMHIFDGQFWFPIDEDDVYTLAYDGVVTPFTEGETVTGGTSGATGYVLHVTPALLYLTDVVGTFVDNETLTSSGGSAMTDGVLMPYYVGITGVDTSTLSYVWTYKNRLYFIQRDSFVVWYLPVDQISGAAKSLNIGAEFSEGGKLLLGSSWSLDSSGDGGLSEQNAFISDEGQVAVYQGLSPEANQGWTKVGLYKIGKPLGPLAWQRAGGDIIIATDIGYVPLSQAINKDVAALSPAAVSYPIETAWNELVAERRSSPWHCAIWPEQQMVIIGTPTVFDSSPMCIVANARTGAWAKFTGWNITCLCVFEGRMFFGSSDGRVVEAYVTGLDEGATFTAACVPQFLDMGNPASLKIPTIARMVTRGPNDIVGQVTAHRDYVVNLPAAPSAAPISTDSVWGGAIWGQSTWGGQAQKQTQMSWQSVGGEGYALAPCGQITSGSIVALDTELIRLELLYTTAENVS